MGKMKITRRKFVADLTAGAGTVLIGKNAVSISRDHSHVPNNPFQKVTLGKSGIPSTLLGMGTGFNGYNRTSAITRAGVAESMIRYAYEKGVRFFDCADSYGTHKYVAAGLKGIPRENYTLSTKMWVTDGGIPEHDKADANIAVDRFRKELNTGYLDLVQLHCMTAGYWTDTHKKQMDILENLKIKGIIRAHGVSVHSFGALEAAAESSWVDIVHVRVNPYGDDMDNKDPEMVVPLIEKLHKSGKGVICMKLIGNGKFRNDSRKIDETLNYVLGLGTVSMIIVGFEYPIQIDNYAGRVEKALRVISKT